AAVLDWYFAPTEMAAGTGVAESHKAFAPFTVAPSSNTEPAMISRDQAPAAFLEMAPSVLRASAVLALVTYFLTPKMARAAKMPTMATTIINSTSVKPRAFCFLIMGVLVCGFAGKTRAGLRTRARRVLGRAALH